MPKSAFYTELNHLYEFKDITDQSVYTPLPDDWFVIVTDVQGSKKAISEGRYKEVNTCGAASITAVINALSPLEVPYVFGGDGASICIPGDYVDQLKGVLLSARNMAKVAFNLDLRAGLVPVSEIRKEGADVLVARLKVSEFYTQAIFTGGGLAIADQIIKSKHGDKYRLQSDTQEISADFTGLECRWKEVKQDNKHVISLLVQATSNDTYSAMDRYRATIDYIESTVKEEHPITTPSLKFSFSPTWLRNEYNVRTYPKKILSKVVYYFRLLFRNTLGVLLMKFDIKIGGFNWKTYKSQLVLHTDYRKFDDMLRVVISASEEEKSDLIAYLNKQEHDGHIVYGAHISDGAIITCMVKKYDGFHYHFVDGSNGGYSVAAKELLRKKNN